MDSHASLSALRALDPATWELPLSSEGARQAWAAALAALEAADVARAIPPPAPARVLVIGSANVFVAPLPWAWHLAARGVAVRIKAAVGMRLAMSAIAEAIPGVEVRDWRGGDLEAEADALRGVEGVLAFGGEAALSAIRGRIPEGVRYLPFGPRFGVARVGSVGPGLVADLAAFDSRGCMSPVAAFVDRAELEQVVSLLEASERQLPRGVVSDAEAAAIRAHVALARSVGAVRTGPGWAVAVLPPRMFRPQTLPRVLTLHPVTGDDEVLDALAPWSAQLGTLALDRPHPGLTALALRVCLPGEMQTPPADGWHDGVDVLSALGGR